MKQIDTFWLAIDLNLDCNRNCSFCCKKYEAPSMYTEGKIDKLIKAMSPTVLKYGAKKVCIPILGGEPLLHPDLPLLIVEKFKCLSPIKIDVWMYTNGDFLTDRIMKEYKEKKIWITLSAAESSLKEIVEKIEFLKHYYKTPRLSVTLSRDNLERLESIVTKSLEMNFTMRFRHQYDSRSWQYDEERLPYLYSEIVPEQFGRYVKGSHITFNNLMFTYEDAIPDWNDVRSPYVCGRSFFHLSSDGRIRTCSGIAKDNVIGQINEENDDLVENLRDATRSGRTGRWSAKDIEECQGCLVYGACQGGCPLTRKLAYGRWDKPSPYCEGIKKTMPIFLEASRRLKNAARISNN